MISSQLRDLNLGELLDTPPPGVDEAVAVSKAGAPAQSRVGAAGAAPAPQPGCSVVLAHPAGFSRMWPPPHPPTPTFSVPIIL
jgi:hypothetical protein